MDNEARCIHNHAVAGAPDVNLETTPCPVCGGPMFRWYRDQPGAFGPNELPQSPVQVGDMLWYGPHGSELVFQQMFPELYEESLRHERELWRRRGHPWWKDPMPRFVRDTIRARRRDLSGCRRPRR